MHSTGIYNEVGGFTVRATKWLNRYSALPNLGGLPRKKLKWIFVKTPDALNKSVLIFNMAPKRNPAHGRFETTAPLRVLHPKGRRNTLAYDTQLTEHLECRVSQTREDVVTAILRRKNIKEMLVTKKFATPKDLSLEELCEFTKKAKAAMRELTKEKDKLTPMIFSMLHEQDLRQAALDDHRDVVLQKSNDEIDSLQFQFDRAETSITLKLPMFWRLPEDMLTYELQLYLIMDRYNMATILKQISGNVLCGFFLEIVKTPHYFSILSRNRQKLQILPPGGRRFDTPKSVYFPDQWLYSSDSKRRQRILTTFHIYRKRYPKVAYEMLRMFAIMIKPGKKYKAAAWQTVYAPLQVAPTLL